MTSNKEIKRTLRRSQSVAPYGVGAIYDVAGESFVAMDINAWESQGEPLSEPRLQEALRVTGFRMAPETSDQPNSGGSPSGVPFMRFPRAMFCPNNECRRIYLKVREPVDSAGQPTGGRPVCPNPRCGKSDLVPMRWVMACPKGHLGDVPWGAWAHSKIDGHLTCRESEQRLRFFSKRGSGGLESLIVHCETCGAKRDLSDLVKDDVIEKLGIQCPGSQPWEWSSPHSACNAIPKVLQRGATNLTFHLSSSAIDIPPYSRYDTFHDSRVRILSSTWFRELKSDSNPPDQIREYVAGRIAHDLKLDREFVRGVIDEELAALQNASGRNSGLDTEPKDLPLADDQPILQIDEFKAFLAPDVEHDRRDRFQKAFVLIPTPAELPENPFGRSTELLFKSIQSLVQVPKLREVRALRGFSRLAPPSYSDEGEQSPGKFSLYDGKKTGAVLVPADLGYGQNWLPAVEVFGEGLFFTLNEDRLKSWEREPSVVARMEVLLQRTDVMKSDALRSTTFNPRTVLLHTLSHLLIRQLSFECGYSLSSLRERLYCGDAVSNSPMAGVLVYTAAGDSEGTLGGLVREGRPLRFASTFLRALQNADWCSSDPLCRESTGQGLDNLNLAACHACALLPETSCTMGNRLLDRTLVLGTPEDRSIGFFGEIVEFSREAIGNQGG